MHQHVVTLTLVALLTASPGLGMAASDHGSGGQEQAHQDRDDRDHHEHLDQREGHAGLGAGHHHWLLLGIHGTHRTNRPHRAYGPFTVESWSPE